MSTSLGLSQTSLTPHAQNDLHLEDSFLLVEREVNDDWRTVRTDAHPSTTFIWNRTNSVRVGCGFMQMRLLTYSAGTGIFYCEHYLDHRGLYTWCVGKTCSSKTGALTNVSYSWELSYHLQRRCKTFLPRHDAVLVDHFYLQRRVIPWGTSSRLSIVISLVLFFCFFYNDLTRHVLSFWIRARLHRHCCIYILLQYRSLFVLPFL